MKTAIVTDSTCDLGYEFLKQNNVFVLPLKVICKDGEYKDGVDITNEEIVKRLEYEIPKTSMPSPGEIKKVFEEIRDQGYEQVVAIHISSGLSGTFNNVKMVSQEFPKLKIEVIDSKMLSLGLGFLVSKAIKLRELGAKFNDIVAQLLETKNKTKIFFVVKTLEYLQRGGRIGKITGSLGQLLDIKPIVSINEEGKYYTYAKVRGRKKSLNRLKEIVTQDIKNKKVDLAVAHSNAEKECSDLLQGIVNNFSGNVKSFFSTQLGPGMIVHCGPGLVGIAYNVLD